MSQLSTQEEHFIRLSLLLTGLSPRAVRALFDLQFPSINLKSALNQKLGVLTNLKSNRVINQSQWNLLFPSLGDPDSKKFDATLMICLIRNLTSVTRPPTGYDSLPSSGDTTSGADLARIKYYRNYLAHLDDNKVDSKDFNKAWKDIADAVGRLGGPDIFQECQDLKVRALDQSNSEIILEIKQSNEQIKDLKRSVEKIRHECRRDIRKKTKKLKTLQKKMEDTIPDNIKDLIKDEIDKWRQDDAMFISTTVAHNILRQVKLNQFVTVTGSSGVGKTFTVRHVALQMAKAGYYIIPVTSPDYIIKFSCRDRKTLFVVDKFCGIYTLSQGQLDSWKCWLQNIEDVILKNKEDKIIMTCRLQVFQDDRVNALPVLRNCICNFSNPSLRLNYEEKQAMAKLYLKSKAQTVSSSLNLFDFFPLLCKLYYQNPNKDVRQFFQHPFSVYEYEMEMLRTEKAYGKYCALALCVMFNNHIEEKLLTEDIGEDKRLLIESTCEACRLDRGTSRLVLLDELKALRDTFIKKEISDWLKCVSYKARHDKYFDIIAIYFGKVMIECVIKHAVSNLISTKFLFEFNTSLQHQFILIPAKHHKLYLQRMVQDWTLGEVFHVFSNVNMHNPNFRALFLKHLKSQDSRLQTKLVNAEDIQSTNVSRIFHGSTKWYISHRSSFVDENSNATALLHSCILGDIDFVRWCIDNDADVNYSNNEHKSPLYIACQKGHKEIVRLLLQMKADVNNCTYTGQSPLFIACSEGETEIVNLLLKNKAQTNISTRKRETPLYTACQSGYQEIVYYLLQQNADLNKTTVNSESPLFAAAHGGHTNTAKMLLENKWIKLNENTKRGQTPLYVACKIGSTECVKILLDFEADIHKCTKKGKSVLYRACQTGNMEIVKMLLDKNADVNKCTRQGKSPLYIASHNGDTEIVKLLLLKNADSGKCSKYGNKSPLFLACSHGYTEIVKMVIENKFAMNDLNTRTRFNESPLLVACYRGDADIVKMLLQLDTKSSLIDLCTEKGKSPIYISCQEGYQDIVGLLLKNGAELNLCTRYGDSPLCVACRTGRADIVKTLLSNNADVSQYVIFDGPPLYIACKKGYLEIVKLLLENHVDAPKFDFKGDSHANIFQTDLRISLDVARKTGYTEIVRLLLDYIADDDGEYPL